MQRPTRILLVDDDPEIIEVMRFALEARGFQVLTARDGNQGLGMIAREKPDLVILDMMMPKRSGFLVLERIRRAEPVPTRVIMITANEGGRHKAYAEMLGVDDYIRKPFAIDRLLDSVDRLIGDPRLAPSNAPRTVPPSFEEFVASLPDVGTPHDGRCSFLPQMTAALAELVGGFCHDLQNRIHALGLALEEPSLREDRIKMLALGTGAVVSDLHRLARQFYRRYSDPLEEVGASSLYTAARDIINQGLGDVPVIVGLTTHGFSSDFSLPKALLRYLLSPLIENSRDSIVAAGVDGAIVATLRGLSHYGLQLTITDNGLGWNGMNRLIEQHIRSNRAFSTKGTDRGHGLINLKRIVTCMNGDLTLSQVPSGGAQVAITISPDAESVPSGTVMPSPVTMAVAEVTGACCHDVANSITGISLELENVARRDLMQRCLDQARDAIGDLHQFVRSLYSADNDGIAHVNAARVSDVIRALAEPLLMNTKIILDVSTNSLDNGFDVPRVLLRHLVVPLVENSIEAISEVGRPGSVLVEVDCSLIEDHFSMSVLDDGPGLSETLVYIERLSLKGKAFSTKSDARGYGLQNLNRLVERIGGELCFGKSPLGGSLVRIVMPASAVCVR